jgi:hypothetical protein
MPPRGSWRVPGDRAFRGPALLRKGQRTRKPGLVLAWNEPSRHLGQRLRSLRDRPRDAGRCRVKGERPCPRTTSRWSAHSPVRRSPAWSAPRPPPAYTAGPCCPMHLSPGPGSRPGRATLDTLARVKGESPQKPALLLASNESLTRCRPRAGAIATQLPGFAHGGASRADA